MVSSLDRTKSASCGLADRRTLLAVRSLSPISSFSLESDRNVVFATDLNNDKATKETFDEDGWVRTGDECKIDEHGLLYVVDRIKECVRPILFLLPGPS
jgi:hypothetical protein